MALVHRFYDMQDGQASIGCRDVRDATQDSVDVQFAIALRELRLLTTTVMVSMAIARPTPLRNTASASGTSTFRAKP